MATRIRRHTNQAVRVSGSHTQITTTGSAQTITNPTDDRATVLIMQNTATTDSATATNIRYTIDGTDPSATKGFLLEDGDPEVRIDFCVPLPTIKVFLSTSAVLDYQWCIPG